MRSILSAIRQNSLSDTWLHPYLIQFELYLGIQHLLDLPYSNKEWLGLVKQMFTQWCQLLNPSSWMGSQPLQSVHLLVLVGTGLILLKKKEICIGG